MQHVIIFEPSVEREGASVQGLPWRCYGPYASEDLAHAALVARPYFSGGRVVLLKDPGSLPLEGQSFDAE